MMNVVCRIVSLASLALALGLALGAATTALLIGWAEPMLRLVGVAEPLLAPGAAVVRAMAFAFPAQFILAAASYFLEGISRGV